MTSLTYSNYSALRRCGQYFKLSILDKVPQPKSVAFEFGSALHAGLHDAITTHDVDSAQDVFGAYWRDDQHKLNFDGERFDYWTLGQMGLKFVANFVKRYAKDMQLIVGEKRFSTKYYDDPEGYVEIQGTPDALVSWNGKNVLLDFKSSAYNYLDEKIDCSLQLNLYAWLLEQNGYRVDEIAYAVFCKGTGSIQRIETKLYEKEKALQMLGEMVSYWKRNEAHYEKNPNSCIMGKQVCPYFKGCWG